MGSDETPSHDPMTQLCFRHIYSGGSTYNMCNGALMFDIFIQFFYRAVEIAVFYLYGVEIL